MFALSTLSSQLSTVRQRDEPAEPKRIPQVIRNRDGAYFSSQARPSVKIFTSLPPFSGFTKIVSAASPRFRFSIAEAGVIRSLPCLVQPWVLRFADNSVHTLLTFALLLKRTCSTSALYSTSDASFVSARFLALS